MDTDQLMTDFMKLEQHCDKAPKELHNHDSGKVEQQTWLSVPACSGHAELRRYIVN